MPFGLIRTVLDSAFPGAMLKLGLPHSQAPTQAIGVSYLGSTRCLLLRPDTAEWSSELCEA